MLLKAKKIPIAIGNFFKRKRFFFSDFNNNNINIILNKENEILQKEIFQSEKNFNSFLENLKSNGLAINKDLFIKNQKKIIIMEKSKENFILKFFFVAKNSIKEKSKEKNYKEKSQIFQIKFFIKIKN